MQRSICRQTKPRQPVRSTAKPTSWSANRLHSIPRDSKSPIWNSDDWSAIVKVVLKDQSTGAKLADQHVSFIVLTTDGVQHTGRPGCCRLLNYTMYAPYYNGSNTVTATYTTNTEYVINGVSGTYLSVYPRLLAAGSKLVVEAATEGYVIKKEIVLSNEIDLETGKITTLNVNLSDEHITAAATGLSLPFTDDFSDLTGNSATNYPVPQRQKRKRPVFRGELLCLSIRLPAWPSA